MPKTWTLKIGFDYASFAFPCKTLCERFEPRRHFKSRLSFVTPYTFPWAGVIYFLSRAVFDAKSIIKKLFIIMHV